MSCRRRWARRKYEVVSARGCLHDYSQLYGASWGRWRGGGGGGQECAESLRGHVRAILKLQKNHGVVIVSIGPHYGSWGVERGDMQLPGHLPGWQYMSRPKDMAQAPQRLRILFPNQKPTFGTSLNCISLECALFDPPPRGAPNLYIITRSILPETFLVFNQESPVSSVSTGTHWHLKLSWS